MRPAVADSRPPALCPFHGVPLRSWSHYLNEGSRYVHADGTEHGGGLDIVERPPEPPSFEDVLEFVHQQGKAGVFGQPWPSTHRRCTGISAPER